MSDHFGTWCIKGLKGRSDEHKKSVRNCICDKNEIANYWWEADHNLNWDQKKLLDRQNRLIPKKIKEAIHSLKNLNRKVSHMLLEIWLPKLLWITINKKAFSHQIWKIRKIIKYTEAAVFCKKVAGLQLY